MLTVWKRKNMNGLFLDCMKYIIEENRMKFILKIVARISSYQITYPIRMSFIRLHLPYEIFFFFSKL